MDRKEKLKMRFVNSRTPVSQSTPYKSPKNYIGCDAKLIPRIKQCMESSNSNLNMSVDSVVDHLQKSYPEYRRKKINSFKKSVVNGLNLIRDESFREDDEMDIAQLTLENVDDIGSDFSFENNYVAYEDANSANDTLREMYSRKPKPLQSNNGISDIVTQDKESEKNKKGQTKKRKAENDGLKQLEGANKAKIRRKKNILPQQSTVTFKDVAGIEDSIKKIWQSIFHLKNPLFSEIICTCISSPTRGILLHGPPGCGKTKLANAIAGELGLPFFKMGGTELVSGVSGESEENIRELFDTAVASAPSLIFLDEIDSIASKRDAAQREMEKRIVSELLTSIDNLNNKDAATQVLVIGATNRPDNVDSALRRPGRFDLEITLGVPNEQARIKILKVLNNNNIYLSPTVNFEEIAKFTPGYTGADLKQLIVNALMRAIERFGLSLRNPLLKDQVDDKLESHEDVSVFAWLAKQSEITKEQLKDLLIETIDFQLAAKELQPAVMRENHVSIPNVTWDDIGALDAVKEELQNLITSPVLFPEQFKFLNMESTGLILCGPPGCGKTTLAQAIANESGINFICVKGPELLNMYVGESEHNLRRIFQQARNCSPCVLFFDEIDSLCPRRSGDADNGASSRVVSTMLNELNGIEGKVDIFAIGATNRPENLDPALLRHKRFGKILSIDFPTPDERVKILNAITKFGSPNSCISPDVSLNEIGLDPRCDGFTGADLANLFHEAKKITMQEYRVSHARGNASADKLAPVTQSHFEKAFGQVRPSVSIKDRKKYEALKKTFCSNYNPKAAMSMNITEQRKEDFNLIERSFNENKLTVKIGSQNSEQMKRIEIDGKLILRIQQHIRARDFDKDITLDDLVLHLFHKFRDYKQFNKNESSRNNFKMKVLKGLNSIQNCKIVLKMGNEC